METKTHKLFQQAVHTLKRGDRATARQIMRQSLLEDPNYAPAWLWMSGLVDEISQQRECLERALELDPTNEPAREGLESLKFQEFVVSLSNSKKDIKKPDHRQSQKLGEYLVEENIITAEQLQHALTEQRRVQLNLQATRVPLGDILIKLKMLTPKQLATILVEQQQDKMSSTESKTPEYLGEYLVTKGIITREQLEYVLAQQIELRQTGQRILLGELLVSAGYISHGTLGTILNQQRTDIFSRFGFEKE